VNILVLENNQHRIKFFQNGLKPHKVTICRHAQAAIHVLKVVSFDIIFLDHDLGSESVSPDEENSGSEVARFIADHEITCGNIILHTENRAGRNAMEAILAECQSIPYGRLKKMGFHSILKSSTANI
jgi:hypothetical protein